MNSHNSSISNARGGAEHLKFYFGGQHLKFLEFSQTKILTIIANKQALGLRCLKSDKYNQIKGANY